MTSGPLSSVNSTMVSLHENVTPTGDMHVRMNQVNETCVFVLLTLIILGFCGNVVIFVVWTGQRAFRPTTFFMKCLSVSDSLLLLSFLFYVAIFDFDGGVDIVGTLVTLSMVCWFRIVSAHTTLAVVFTRWLAVYKPLKVNSLLTKRRVVLGFILIILWCVTAFMPLFIIIIKDSSRLRTDLMVINVTETVYLAFPIVLLVLFNGHIVYRLRTNHSCHDHGIAVESSSHSQHQRLFAAVLCLSITTVLAYPLGVVSRIFLNLTLTYVDPTTVNRMLCVSMVLEAFNSSINVVYYLVFLPRFWQLFCHRCCCCCSCRGNSE